MRELIIHEFLENYVDPKTFIVIRDIDSGYNYYATSCHYILDYCITEELIQSARIKEVAPYKSVSMGLILYI